MCHKAGGTATSLSLALRDRLGIILPLPVGTRSSTQVEGAGLEAWAAVTACILQTISDLMSSSHLPVHTASPLRPNTS